MRLLRITTVPISLKILLKGQLEYMRDNGFEVLAVSSDGPEIKDLKIPHRVVNMTRKITPLKDFIALVRLVSIIREYRPDIVHTHTPKAGIIGMLAARISRVPVRIHTIGGLPWLESGGFKKWILKRVEELTIWSASDVLINSARLGIILKNEIPTIKRTLNVIGQGSTNGIEMDFYNKSETLRDQAFLLRNKLEIKNGDFVFCFIGRLVRHKGIEELIAAFQRLKNEFFNLKLFLVGYVEDDREPLSGSSQKMIQESKDIFYTGMVEDVRQWLAASDAFVFPSYREGFPNALLQAACMGVPVIATDINGCNEIVSGEEMGLLIPPKNEEHLYKAMKYFLEHPEDVQKFSENLKKHVVTNYDQKFIWSQILALYLNRMEKYCTNSLQTNPLIKSNL